jgi:hypothetical protein
MMQNPRSATDTLPNAALPPLPGGSENGDRQASSGDSFFATPAGVISVLRRYRDVSDPKTTSLLLVSRQGYDPSQGPFRAGFVSRLDEREELRRRMAGRLGERERKLLFLWYVVELRPGEVARRIRVSRVHCYRLRNAALDALCDERAPGRQATAILQPADLPDALPSPPGGKGLGSGQPLSTRLGFGADVDDVCPA